MTLKKAVGWLVEDGAGTQFLYGYERDALDKIHDELADGVPRKDITLSTLVPYDRKAAGELRKLRSFVKQVAYWHERPSDAPADVLEAITQAAADLLVLTQKKGKKR